MQARTLDGDGPIASERSGRKKIETDSRIVGSWSGFGLGLIWFGSGLVWVLLGLVASALQRANPRFKRQKTQIRSMKMRVAWKTGAMTRPGLEPGISSSGGRRLIHSANRPINLLSSIRPTSQLIYFRCDQLHAFVAC